MKDSPNYPQGFRGVQNGTVNNTVKDKPLLKNLRKIEQGRWQKVYQDGYDAAGNQVSIHYFRSQSGEYWKDKTRETLGENVAALLASILAPSKIASSIGKPGKLGTTGNKVENIVSDVNNANKIENGVTDAGKISPDSKLTFNPNSQASSPSTKPIISVESIKSGCIDELPANAQDIYSQYEKGGCSGNVSGQTTGTYAGSMFKYKDGIFPSADRKGNPITYKEFDVNNKLPDQKRDAERFLRGSDGSLYYTNDHYGTFTKIK